jgi:hypothetical protein
VCAAQELRKGSPTILVLDAPDTWIDKSVPSIDFAPVAHLQSCPCCAQRCAAAPSGPIEVNSRAPPACARARCRYNLTRIQLPDYKESCHYTTVSPRPFWGLRPVPRHRRGIDLPCACGVDTSRVRPHPAAILRCRRREKACTRATFRSCSWRRRCGPD